MTSYFSVPKISRFLFLAAISLFQFLSLSSSTQTHNRSPEYFKLPPLREQAILKDSWTEDRVSKIPQLLQKHGVDAWIISQKEYAEDTVFWSLKPSTAFSARRRTTLLFLANTTTGPSSYTWIDNTPQLWASLRKILDSENPSRIALNVDAEIAFSSGLHAGELNLLQSSTGISDWSDRFVSVPMLAVEFIATMPKAQLEWYRKLQSTAWSMISEAFSEAVITPGVTTTADVEWWLREQTQVWNYTTWFMPDVSILPLDSIGKKSSKYEEWEAGQDMYPREDVIQFGDLLHVDFGVTALGMNTDTQHLAYVLFPGENERDVPKGLKEGLKKGNRLQDILRGEMKRGVGKKGNQLLKAALKQMRQEGFEGSIYSHPIGDWGHSAGTLIGMTNLQSGVPILGDLPLLKNTYYSIELYAEHFIPERNRTMNFYLEEDVYWDEENESWEWVFGRQEEFWFVRTEAGRPREGNGGSKVQELK